MISFDNTGITFIGKENKVLFLERVLLIFFSKPNLARIYKGWLRFISTLRIPAGWISRSTLHQKFIGGRTKEETLPVIAKINKYQVRSVLEYSPVNGKMSFSKDQFFRETKDCFEYSVKQESIFGNVIKPTSLISKEILEKLSDGRALDEGEAEQYSVFLSRVEELCQISSNNSKTVLIEAEEISCQLVIDRIAMELMEKFNKDSCIVYNTSQMYRTDRLQYLFKVHRQAVEKGFIYGAKIVRGAFLEKERARAEKEGLPLLIHDSKTSTDRDFNEALKYIIYNLDTINLICCTHNEETVQYLTCLMDSHNIKNNDPGIYFTQQYGVGDSISFNLALNGYNVVKLIPYGPVRQNISYLISKINEIQINQSRFEKERLYYHTEWKRRRSIKQ